MFSDSEWPQAQIELQAPWALMLYTDGLVEGRVGDGSRRLDTEGLVTLTRQAHSRGLTGHELLDTLVAWCYQYELEITPATRLSGKVRRSP